MHLFGPVVHSTKVHDLLQIDYIEIAPSLTGEKYVLRLRDNRSRYKRIFEFQNTSAESLAQAIIN